MDLVRYSGSDDWSALYIDGKLDMVGDHYLIDERISSLMKVTVIDSDSFMLGRNFEYEVARTLNEIEKFDKVEKAKAAQKQLLLDQAKLLIEQAKSLDVKAENI